jgi:hypothetical protein
MPAAARADRVDRADRRRAELVGINVRAEPATITTPLL